MLWMVIIFSVVGMWSMLAVFGGERRRQIMEVEARKHAEVLNAPPPSSPTN